MPTSVHPSCSPLLSYSTGCSLLTQVLAGKARCRVRLPAHWAVALAGGRETCHGMNLPPIEMAVTQNLGLRFGVSRSCCPLILADDHAGDLRILLVSHTSIGWASDWLFVDWQYVPTRVLGSYHLSIKSPHASCECARSQAGRYAASHPT